MDFNNWLNQTKKDEPQLEKFITKLQPYFFEGGFKARLFETKVTTGLNNIDTEIEELLKPEPNVED